MKKILCVIVAILFLASTCEASFIGRGGIGKKAFESGKLNSYDLNVTHELDWSGGNVIYVPLSGDIETYVNNASAGDTLILASGTYTITDDIDIDKSINIVGQGVEATTINCATSSKNVFDIAASDVRIADLYIFKNTGGGGTGINTSRDLDDIYIENVKIQLSASNDDCINIYSSNVTIRDCHCFSGSSVIGTQNYGIYFYNDSSSTQSATVTCYNTYSFGRGLTGGNGFTVYNNNDANTLTMTLYDCYGESTIGAGASSTSVTTNNSTINIYGGKYNGLTYDLIQTGTNTLNVYGATLEDGTTSGTITYDGQVVTEDLYVDDDTVLNDDVEWRGGNVWYLTADGNIETAISSAAAGDTIILAAGTYTITDDIDVGKKVSVIGQGQGITIIDCSTAAKNAFDLAASDVRISNLSITMDGGSVDTGINVQTDLTGIVIENVDVTMSSAAGARYGILSRGSDVVLRDCKFIATSSDDMAYAFYAYNGSGTGINSTMDCFECYGEATGGATQANGFNVYNANDANTVHMNLYNCTGVANSGTASDAAFQVGSVTTSNASGSAYNCTFDGADYDVNCAVAGNTLYVSGSTLVNTKINATGTVDFGTNDAWSTWTSTLTWNTANPESGAADVLSTTGRYKVANGICYFSIYITWDDGENSTGLATATLPITPKDTNTYPPCSVSYYVDPNNTVGMVLVDATTPAGLIGAVAPTFTDGNVGGLRISGFYEI